MNYKNLNSEIETPLLDQSAVNIFPAMNYKNLNSEIETSSFWNDSTAAFRLWIIRISILRLKRICATWQGLAIRVAMNYKNLNSEIETHVQSALLLPILAPYEL